MCAPDLSVSQLSLPPHSQQNRECLNIFIFVPSAPCLRPFLFVNIHPLCLCGNNHMRTCCSDKRKILPCSNCKGFEMLPGSCRVGCDSAGMMPVEMLETTRIRICCDPQNQSWSYYTGLSSPAVPGCCNLNFRTVSEELLHSLLLTCCARML